MSDIEKHDWRRAVEHARAQNETHLALELCTAALVAEGPSTEILLKRASIHASVKRFDLAVQDATAAISVETREMQPFAHFQRSRWLMEAGDFEDAEVDLSRVISAEESLENKFYTNASLLLRSFCRLHTGDLEGAEMDAKAVPERGRIWTCGYLITGREILTEIEAQRTDDP